MNIIDANALIHATVGGQLISGDYFVTEDLEDEFELAEIINKLKLPRIKSASTLVNYDEAYYLRQYAYMLNKYGGYSFVNMGGFGDISILALVKAYKENFGRPVQSTLELFGAKQQNIIVYTDDNGLAKKITSEFGDAITVLSSKDIPLENLNY